VMLNAAAAIAAFDGEQNLDVHERISRSLKRAEEAVDSGATTALLQRWISLTQSLVAPS
jgi:anthranilate phosphoribosyltransferase